MVNVRDFASRPPRGLAPTEALETGRHRFRYVPTPQLPHGWDAGVLFEETDRILLCSDLFHQIGDVEPITRNDIIERYRNAIATYQAHPVLMDYMPFTPLFNATGQPAMSVPLHWNAAGLPIGVQFVANFGSDDLLFRLAGQLERARPWFQRVPPGY